MLFYAFECLEEYQCLAMKEAAKAVTHHLGETISQVALNVRLCRKCKLPYRDHQDSCTGIRRNKQWFKNAFYFYLGGLILYPEAFENSYPFSNATSQIRCREINQTQNRKLS